VINDLARAIWRWTEKKCQHCVGAETFAHVDVDADEYFQQLEELTAEYPKELVDESGFRDWDYEKHEMSENDLWQPFSSLEPLLDAAAMEQIESVCRSG